MKSSKQEIIINHRAKDLYKIVLDIGKYPEYIPWCKKIIIKSKTKNEILADMIVCYKYFFPHTFTSHVIFDSNMLKISGFIAFIDFGFKNEKLLHPPPALGLVRREPPTVSFCAFLSLRHHENPKK